MSTKQGRKVCPECAGQPFTNCDGTNIVCEHCHGTGYVIESGETGKANKQ